jgi:hypothetical protein
MTTPKSKVEVRLEKLRYATFYIMRGLRTIRVITV